MKRNEELKTNDRRPALCAAPVVSTDPPLLTGGLDSQKKTINSIGADWIQGSFPVYHRTSIINWVRTTWGIDGVEHDYGMHLYDTSMSWDEFGISVLWDTDGKRYAMHKGRCMLRLPGKALSSLTAEQQCEVFNKLLYEYDFKCTRLDLRFDDYRKTVSVGEVYDHADKGNYTGFRTHEYVVGRRVSGVPTGETLYFGRRGKNGGGKFLRVYDKDLESKGEIPAIRWELELSKEKAQKAFYRIAELAGAENMAGMMGAIIGGCIDFVDRQSKNMERNERLPFWKTILKLLGRVQIKTVHVPTTLEEKEKWVKSSVANTLAMIRIAKGPKFEQWLKTLCEVAEGQLSAEQRQAVMHYYKTTYRGYIGPQELKI